MEVKSSKDDKWLSLGGSVNESTRIAGVERIFLTFGKLLTPVEFRSRPYEDCLSDVTVTHYPRYRIDMNLPSGETIFHKMDTTYDELRLSPNPVGQIVDYYKSQLAYGESLWWTGKATQDEPDESVEEAAFMKIRLFNSLTLKEKQEVLSMGFALFPDVLGNSNRKYERFALWLAATHGIVSTSTRDMFSAGGRETIHTVSTRYHDVPRALKNIEKHSSAIAATILKADESVLLETWKVKSLYPDRIGQWIELIASAYDYIHPDFDVETLLNAIFNRE